jgi:hypothetical protein
MAARPLFLMMGLSLAACDAPTAQKALGPTESVSEVESSQAVVTAQVAASASPVVASNFGGGGLSWGSVGSMMFRFAALEQNGEVVICGAYTRRGSSNARALSREAMRQATVTVNGETIMRDMRFFTAASSGNWESSLIGIETNCRSTGQPAGSVSLNAVGVEIREGRYRVRR